MIYYFSPYDKRGLGYAYNSHCALVPEDSDWICLLDQDTMFFSSQRAGEQLEEIVAEHHPRFAAFTTVTNRAYRTSQQQLKHIRQERDLVKLKQRADWQVQHRRGERRVEELRMPINGHLMLFPKWLWKQFPFAEAGSSKKALGHHILGIDTDWRDRLVAAGHKIGLIHSLMVTHFYRMDDPTEKFGHLPASANA